MLRFGYNTNGLAHHRLDDALVLLAELGYRGCALTLDAAHLDPYARGLADEVARIGALARSLELSLVIETGARFLLDPKRKHQPNLLSEEPAGRARRIEFYGLAIAIARDLGAEAVSLWSGSAPAGSDDATAWARLVDGLGEVLARAEPAGVPVAFEPEPGMFVGDLAGYVRLRASLPALKLTLDLGHAHLTEPSVVEAVRQFAAALVNVHAEDMRRPVHEHLPFGQGEMDYKPILAALNEIDYRGLINVELSRDSHRGADMARAALAYLKEHA